MHEPRQNQNADKGKRVGSPLAEERPPGPHGQPETIRRISVIDSHTGGEPTRVITEGGPDLGAGSLAERRQRFSDAFDSFRTAVVNEPRGSDVLVGALLVPPTDASSVTGVIFFNNVGYLGMCGHGLIGVVATLAHQGTLDSGTHTIETPVGNVTAKLHSDARVSVTNVPSYRLKKSITFDVPKVGRVTGDIAWGGNWFFLTEDHEQALSLDRLEELTTVAWHIRQAVNAQGFPQVDHIELFGAATEANSKSFVLCPGKAYDRSPCGTGTSAKLACLADDGKLAPGDVWTQESITGSTFTATYQRQGEHILPTITGTAFVCGESVLLLNEKDPLCWGLVLD